MSVVAGSSGLPFASQFIAGLLDGLKRRAAGLALPAAMQLRLPARHAQVVQALPIGPGVRLLVVEFGGRRLLIGQSRAGLSALSDLPAE
ncbi:flagellar biosynthetic protein FliO [Sandarakinorhabdus sp.]|uniref:flagellar biosynthetic protein FliO n=1 Tax=Sandarakinorhabdus sp. TaxID=1916663 RepID=UPI00333E2945